MGAWTMTQAFELLRGTFALHTRSYQAKARPLKPDSWFAQLFGLVGEIAQRKLKQASSGGDSGPTRGLEPVALTPIGRRSPIEAAEHAKLSVRSISNPDAIVPDPAFIPDGKYIPPRAQWSFCTLLLRFMV